MEEKEQTIDLKVLLNVMLEHLIPIAAAAIAAAVIGLSLAAFIIPKQYTSEALLYVVNSTDKTEQSSININDINAAQKIVNTCQILFTSDYILKELENSFNGMYTAGQLKGMISIQSVNSTEILSISVKNNSPEQAAAIAEKLVELSKDEFMRVIKNGSIEVVSSPSVPHGATFPNVRTFTLIGFALGLVGSYAIFLIIELVDTKVKPSDDLSTMYNIPVFAEIVDFETADKSGYKYKDYSSSTKKTEKKTSK